MSNKQDAASPKEQLIDLLKFVEFINLFRAKERAIWYKGVLGQERNGEHSFQLAMCAWFLNGRLSLELDTARLVSYSLVHDLVETYADDTPAFTNLMTWRPEDDVTHISRRNKEEREHAALERIRQEWSVKFQPMVEYIESYGRQSDRESRFVYALDKLIAALNVYEDGGSTYRKLGLTLEMVDTYQRPKIEKDETVLVLYEELHTLITEWEGSKGFSFFGGIVPGSMKIGGPQ